jgi:hypothetical protein
VEHPGDFFRGTIGQERGAGFGPQFAEGLHGELAVAFDEEREGGGAILFTELGEDLREVGGVLLLEQIDEIRRCAESDQALDGIEYDVNFPLSHTRIVT